LGEFEYSPTTTNNCLVACKMILVKSTLRLRDMVYHKSDSKQKHLSLYQPCIYITRKNWILIHNYQENEIIGNDYWWEKEKCVELGNWSMLFNC